MTAYSAAIDLRLRVSLDAENHTEALSRLQAGLEDVDVFGWEDMPGKTAVEIIGARVHSPEVRT